MKLVRVDSIIIPKDRQRKFFDIQAMEDLKKSIEDRGLLQAIILRPVDGNLYEGFELVAGERRLRAVSEIHDLGGTIRHDGGEVEAGHIPFTLLSDLSPLEAEEAQLDENLRRANLTWQEHAQAVARLERLRLAQSKESACPPPTLESLAEESFIPKREGFAGGASSYAKDQVRKELIVAKYLDRPEVKAAKSLDEAFKVLVRQEELAKSEELGRAVGQVFTRASHTLINGNCLEILHGLDSGFDVILTDPPYGMGADDFGDSGGRTMDGESIHSYRDDDSIIVDTVLPALELASRLCKPQAHAYVFCDIDRFAQLRDFFRSLGWEPFRTPLIWDKGPTKGRVPLPQHGPRRTYETILYAYRGKRPVRKVSPDILQFGPDENLNLAAQKPVALYAELLARSCLPGDRALDMFCGTGPVLPAAHSLKVKATCIEQNPQVYGIAAERLKELK